MSNKKIKIGLTGGIGVGKTYVGQIFINLGYPVFNADIEAKECIQNNNQLQNSIKNKFGEKIYVKGVLQREKLADIVFNDVLALKQLNNLVHPIVKKKFDDWCEKQTAKIIIKEAAILFESNSHITLDHIICVSTNLDTRIERIKKRDNISRKQIIDRIENQMPQIEKEKLSDFVINNDGTQLILPQVLDIIYQIN